MFQRGRNIITNLANYKYANFSYAVDCYDDFLISGINSYHDNKREDRRWKFKCAELLTSQYSFEISVFGLILTITSYNAYIKVETL